MESLIFNAKVVNNVAIGVSHTTVGVVIADNKFLWPGSVITTQEEADALPRRIGIPYDNTNEEVVHIYKELAERIWWICYWKNGWRKRKST